MSRHKLDIYIDASLDDIDVGIGIVMEFDNNKCFHKGDISKLKTSHTEVAEFITLHRTLERLVGGKTQEFYNTDICIFTDSSVLEDYINSGITPKTFPHRLMSSCNKLMCKLRNDKYNNTLSLEWISRERNKAHIYAYNASIYNVIVEESQLYEARRLSAL